MDRPSVQNTLTGRRVLVVHEDPFFGAYLGDVIAESGATVIGVVSCADRGTALLASGPPPCLLVLSVMVRGGEAIAHAAAASGVATLLVRPARGASPPATGRSAVLTAPFAGFQVVDALRHLLPDRVAADHCPLCGR